MYCCIHVVVRIGTHFGKYHQTNDENTKKSHPLNLWKEEMGQKKNEGPLEKEFLWGDQQQQLGGMKEGMEKGLTAPWASRSEALWCPNEPR